MATETDIQKKIAQIATEDTARILNVKLATKALSFSGLNCELVSYETGEQIVAHGQLIHEPREFHERFNYAMVPLGLVVKGEVTVVHDGKGVRKLGQGDFIGLFETSDFLVNNRKHHIGNWTLIANSATEIVFLDRTILKSMSLASQELCLHIISLARLDKVPKPLSTLPLLDWIAGSLGSERLSDCAIIAHSHILPTSVSLFRHLGHLVNPGNIFVLDKPYSSIRESLNELTQTGIEVIPVVAEQGVPYELSLRKAIDYMWGRVVEVQKRGGFKKLIIIDDGADVLLSIPWSNLTEIQIVGVEQTQRGITRIENFSGKLPPVVSVATSSIKKNIESVFIGRAIVNKLNALRVFKNVNSIGVLGLGSIGLSIVDSLKLSGKIVYTYDSRVHTESNVAPTTHYSVDSLMEDADIVIGATGEDSFRGVMLEKVTGHKILVSASSSDLEFRSLLKLVPYGKDHFQSIVIPVHKGLEVDILNGGFPINFDRKIEWEPAEDIVLTRCLLYMGVIQASDILKEKIQAGIVILNIEVQEKLILKWKEQKIRPLP